MACRRPVLRHEPSLTARPTRTHPSHANWTTRSQRLGAQLPTLPGYPAIEDATTRDYRRRSRIPRVRVFGARELWRKSAHRGHYAPASDTAGHSGCCLGPRRHDVIELSRSPMTRANGASRTSWADALTTRATTPAFRPSSLVMMAAVTDDTITVARIRASLFGRIGGSATVGPVTIGSACCESSAIARGH